jgi:hypothetical protein
MDTHGVYAPLGRFVLPDGLSTRRNIGLGQIGDNCYRLMLTWMELQCCNTNPHLVDLSLNTTTCCGYGTNCCPCGVYTCKGNCM